MSIYIKDMKMPQSCLYCAFNYDLFKCLMTGESTFHLDYDEKLINCPLIPIPPHGDLIDRDKLREKEFIHDGDAYAVVMSRDIRNAPTIIPAEEDKI